MFVKNIYIFSIGFFSIDPDWKKYNDKTYSRPRDYRLSASWGANRGPPMKTPSNIKAVCYLGV